MGQTTAMRGVHGTQAAAYLSGEGFGAQGLRFNSLRGISLLVFRLGAEAAVLQCDRASSNRSGVFNEGTRWRVGALLQAPLPNSYDGTLARRALQGSKHCQDDNKPHSPWPGSQWDAWVV
jgi:hypothetical protein